MKNNTAHIISSIKKYLNKILVVSVVLLSISVNAQDKKSTLEAKKKKILQEIQYTQKLLSKTKASKESTLADVQALNKQIELRQKLIQEIEIEVLTFTDKINQNVTQLKKEEQQLSALKKEYADAIVRIYKSQRFSSKLLFILNAKSFSEALRRVNYLRKYADFRQVQAAQIIEKKSDISTKIANIDAKKKTKEQLLNGKVKEKQQLNKTITQKNVAVKSLNQKEQQLQNNINAKQAAAAKLDAQIEAIIKKEIELARLAEEKKQKEAAAKAAAEAAAIAAKKKAAEDAIKKAKEQGKAPAKADLETVAKVETTPVPTTATPEYNQLSSNFLGNKGKLPWPVEKGFISKTFGRYTVAGSNIVMENNGIDIRTDAGSNVRSVFDGKVVGILNNPTFKNAVIVSHGDYFTVYSKLAEVSVAKGQSISTKQVIGKAYTDEENITEVHLEVWKGAGKLNPSDWVYKK